MIAQNADFEDQEIIKNMIKRYRKLTFQLDACKNALLSYGIDPGRQMDNVPLFSEKSKPKIRLYSEVKTLRQQAEAILQNEQIPMTTREIMEKLNSNFNRRYELKKFSGNFSLMYRKKSSNIQKYEFGNELLFEYRVIYGLKNWFNSNGMPKDEYLNKYLDAHSIVI